MAVKKARNPAKAIKKEKEPGERKQAIKSDGKFTGRESELDGKVFTVGTGLKIDQFADTLREIAMFVGRTYKQGSDVKRTLEYLTEFALTEPVPPANMNDDAKKFKWQQKFRKFRKLIMNEKEDED